MGLKETRLLDAADMSGYLDDRELPKQTWHGTKKWRRSGGTRWCAVYSQTWRMYVSGRRLIFYSKLPGRVKYRWVSPPLSGQELGPLLEAIIFSQEEKPSAEEAISKD